MWPIILTLCALYNFAFAYLWPSDMPWYVHAGAGVFCLFCAVHAAVRR